MITEKNQPSKQGADLMKRKLLVWLGLMPIFSGCKAAEPIIGQDIKRRFRGINGVVLVVDAIPGVEKKGVSILNENGLGIYTSSLVAKRNREIMAFGGAAFSVPKTVRVTWREGENLYNYREQRYDGGVITGDYTIEIASRIPDDVLDSMRKNGGALRLKFRLKDDGVLFGWDIERDGGGISKFDLPGGDFLESKY